MEGWYTSAFPFKFTISSIRDNIESRMQEIADKINKKNSIIERDPLDSELRILDWLLYQVCSNKLKSSWRWLLTRLVSIC
jgi:hypothetical protein